MEQTENRNPDLWEMAKERAKFKVHLFTYLLVNLFLWILWFVSTKMFFSTFAYWPVYPMAGWGIGLMFHYLRVYHWTQNIAQKEYDKLIKKQNKN